jgi:excisionase family DNA binding protein
MADTSSYLTIPQLAQRLGCAHSTLYAQLKQGTFPFPIVRVGSDVRVPLEAVVLAESGVSTELAALRAEMAVDRAERTAHREAMASIVGALAALFIPPPAVVAMSAATTVQATGEVGTKLAKEVITSEPRQVGAAGETQRLRGARRTGGAIGGHHRAPAQRAAGGRPHQSTGAAD